MRGRAACLAARAARARTAAAAAAATDAGAATAHRWLPDALPPTTTTSTAAAAFTSSWARATAAAGGGHTRSLRGFASSSSAPASSSSSPSPATTTPSTSSPGVTLTPAAADRIRELVSRPAAVQAGHTALRLTVEAGGCSGFSYVFALDSGPKPGDAVVTAHGEGGEASPPPATLIIDPVSLDLVRGGTVDFVTELIKAGFEVTANPNADGGCGCGASFTPKF